MKQIFHITIALVLFSSIVHGFPLINDGSFENHCSTGLCAFTPTGGIYSGPDWNVNKADNAPFLVIQDTNTNHRATDGNYYADLSVKVNSHDGMALIMKTPLNGGVIYYDVNAFIWHHPGTGALILYGYLDGSGAQTLFHSTVKSQVEGLDKNFTLPNVPGYFEVVLSTTGNGSGGDSNFIIDNIRHFEFPIIRTDLPPYTTHPISGVPFYIDVNFSSGYTCTVSDGSSTYSTTDLGNGLYQSQPITVNATGSVSVSKTYSATCNGQQNTDTNWILKINEHNLISSNGGFDVNGNPNLTTSTSTAIKDWNFSTGGASPGRFQVFDNNSASGHVSTDGQKYLRLTSSATFNSDIQSKEKLQGGIVYYDVLDFNNGFPDANFTILYTYDSNGATQTLFTSNTESTVKGENKSVVIPNELGNLTFRLGGASTSRAFVLLDDIRYPDPIFSDSSLCKQIIHRGSSSQKIDLVFEGSGYQDFNQFETAVQFVLDGDENGLFSYEPFKSNEDKFNVWMVDQYKTYQMYQGINGSWKFGPDAIVDAITACPAGNEFSLLSLTPRFQPYSIPPVDLNGEWTPNGKHWNFTFLGCEATGDCNYPVDFNVFNPYSLGCQGNDTGDCNISAKYSYENQRIFSHEFGHSFGGLTDEYQAKDNNGGSDAGVVNCDALNYCPKWLPAITDASCASPCFYPNWHRAYYRTLMTDTFGTDHIDYRTVNERELLSDIQNYKENPVSSFKSLLVVLAFSNGLFSPTTLSIIDAPVPNLIQNPSQYRIKIIDSNSSTQFDANLPILNAALYEPDAINFDSDGNQVTTPTRNMLDLSQDSNVIMIVPYGLNANTLEIQDQNNSTVLSVNISGLSYSVDSIIGRGGNSISSTDYNAIFTLLDQPVKILTSQSYIMKLGWGIYDEN